MTNEEALAIVSSWINSCHDLAENNRCEAMDEPSERESYMKSAERWDERAEAFGIILDIAKEAMETE